MAEETEQTTPAASTPEAVPKGRSREEILRDPLVSAVANGLSDAVREAREFAGELTLIIDRGRIREVAAAFKRDGFTYLVDLTGVDYSKFPGHTGDRFGVTYHLYSFSKNQRVRLKVFTPEGTPVPSVTSVWKTANWHERETYDMFGIEFTDHPNLERILMWEGFNGHPLRKDFPVRGIDTGARIYPEVFPPGGGPMPGSTGKDVKDVNLFQGEWTQYGRAPVGPPPPSKTPPQAQQPAPTQQIAPPSKEALAKTIADTAKPSEEAPWHDPDMPMAKRMELAARGGVKDKLFAAMAQTDCTACGWDCEGYAAALASGESKDPTLCVPGEAETEEMLITLMKDAGLLTQ
jgi:NADH-quinone oxidoreductase subunit C